jgi:hypothetical protein
LVHWRSLWLHLRSVSIARRCPTARLFVPFAVEQHQSKLIESELTIPRRVHGIDVENREAASSDPRGVLDDQ